MPAGPPRAGSPCRAGTLGNPAATALVGYFHHRPSAAGTITLPHVGVNGVAWGVHTLPTDDMSSFVPLKAASCMHQNHKRSWYAAAQLCIMHTTRWHNTSLAQWKKKSFFGWI